jgi:hypothetical protein
VPFSRREPHRNPLQRLSDQRRSLALAGLALGAVFSAAIFRRKRRGEEVAFESTVRFEEPVAAPPEAARPEPEAPVAPEPDDVPQPINAAQMVQSAAEAGPAAEAGTTSETGTTSAAPSPLEPATGELSAEEASILSVLAQSGRSDDDRTAIAVATSLERETGDVTGVLRKLGAEGVVSGDLYTASGDKIWAVTERGVRRLGAQS